MLPERAARAERHIPAAGTAGCRPYRSADVSFRCECGWGPPSGSRRVSTLVAAHLRAHGCPRPRPACALTPAARALGVVARQSLRDAQWADWLAIAPAFAHRGHKLSRQIGCPKRCRLQHHCMAVTLGSRRQPSACAPAMRRRALPRAIPWSTRRLSPDGLSSCVSCGSTPVTLQSRTLVQHEGRP